MVFLVFFMSLFFLAGSGLPEAKHAWPLHDLEATPVQGPVEVTALARTGDVSLQCVRLTGPVRAHRHLKHTETIVILAGRGIFTIEGVDHPAGPGDVFLIPPGTLHAFEVKESPVSAATTFSPPFDGKDRVFEGEGTSSPD